MTKAQKTKLLRMAKQILTHRRIGRILEEQRAWEALQAECDRLNLSLEAGEVVQQAIDYLKRTSIAASMNGLV